MYAKQCAWAAGVIDGESTFVETGSGSTRIAVNMCHKPTVYKLYCLFGGQFRAHAKPLFRQHRQQWHWEVLGGDVLRVLDLIEPYLVTKHEEAKVLKKIAEAMREHGHGPLSASERLQRGRWSERLRELKRIEWKNT
jgi:hypothetical protein